MSDIDTKILQFLPNEEGATEIEYSGMLFLIVAVCLVAINEIGSHNAEMYDGILSGVTDAREATENSRIKL